LKKDETKGLNSGNVISLLPDTLCFEVICEGNLGENGVEKEHAETSPKKTTDSFLPVTDKTVAHNQEKPLASSKVPTGKKKNNVLFGICLSILSYNFLPGVSKKLRTNL